jgi:signal transduction histidine kinase
MNRPHRPSASLGTKLLVAHLLVVAAGIVTVFVTASLIGTSFFERHVAHMHGFGAGPEQMLAVSDAMAAELNAAFRRSLTESLLIAGALALGVAVAASAIVSRQVVGPLARLATAAQRIARGYYAERVPGSGTDELDQLAVSFNEMAAALEDAERRRRQLIGDVAHELRTPLATLSGYLEGLQDGVVQPSDRTWAMLGAETARLTRLVEDLQELSRAEAHQLSLALQPVDATTAVQAAVDRLAPEFVAKGLTLDVTVPPGLSLRADPDRLIQVLTNLLSNALRYTPAPGHVQLAVSRTSQTIRFQVQDTGVGIAAEHLPHVFERFYRVDKSRARALGGSGIGLTITKALVEAMGGHIAVASAGAGQGTTVTVELPLATAA